MGNTAIETAGTHAPRANAGIVRCHVQSCWLESSAMRHRVAQLLGPCRDAPVHGAERIQDGCRGVRGDRRPACGSVAGAVLFLSNGVEVADAVKAFASGLGK